MEMPTRTEFFMRAVVAPYMCTDAFSDAVCRSVSECRALIRSFGGGDFGGRFTIDVTPLHEDARYLRLFVDQCKYNRFAVKSGTSVFSHQREWIFQSDAGAFPF